MTSLPRYALRSDAQGPQDQPLYLNADSFGKVTVQYSVEDTSSWYPFANRDGSVVFINVSSEKVLTVTPDNSLTMSPLGPAPDNHNSWTFATNAVRPQFDADLNLNVRGNSYPAGTDVILYKWDNEPNTKWRLVRTN
jgi:hypothetical protein